MNEPIPAQSNDAIPSTRPYSQWFEPHPQLGISLMDHLFNRLDGAYPQKWRSNFPSQQAVDNWYESWVEAFEEEGITPEEVRGGLSVVRKLHDWPPSCAQFIRACRPYMDPLVAYHEAALQGALRERDGSDTWSHPAIFWAWKAIGQHDFAHLGYAMLRTRWEAALAAEFGRTPIIPVPRKLVELPAPGRGTTQPARAREMLLAYRQRTREASSALTADPLAWAAKLAARHAQGETLTYEQLKILEQVLGGRP